MRVCVHMCAHACLANEHVFNDALSMEFQEFEETDEHNCFASMVHCRW